jgi:hypothetical protein
MDRIAQRRYGDGVPWNGAFFLVYGGCRACSDGDPGCTRLVWNPIGTLLDREKWPDHWNTNVWRGLVERWAANTSMLGTLDGAPTKKYIVGEDPRDPNVWPSGGELALWAWQNVWPIPLGHGSLARFIDDGVFPSESNPRRLCNIVPFGGEEYGALILFGSIGESLVEFFGLAEPVLDAEGKIERFKSAEAVFRVTGFDLANADLHRFTVNARRWWAKFADQPIPVPKGRTPGTILRDRDYYLTHYRNGKSSRELGQSAGKSAFVRYLQTRGDQTINRATLDRNVESYWGSWEAFTRAAARPVNRARNY